MRTCFTAVIAAMGVASFATAQEFDLIGGQTNVVLNTDALASAASLELSGTAGPVIAPGELPAGMGETSVAFPINARNGSLPTSFSFDGGLTAFSGTIEHSGSVLFNMNGVEVGDFTIGFDGGRVGDDRSGFFVESTAGLSAILFDLAAPDVQAADSTTLTIAADLLVSNEFGLFLFDNDLSMSNLAGTPIGSARVDGIVPAPGATVAIAGVGGLALARRRR